MVETEALLVSAALEGPIGFLIARATRWPCRGPLHVGLACAVATAVTHPQVWAAAFWAYPYFPFWPTAIVLEALVIVAEGLMIAWMAQLTLPRAMLVSLVANSSSFLFGLWLAS